jgi:NAD kinase
MAVWTLPVSPLNPQRMSVTALNEVFIGHVSHQSAKYDIHYQDQIEYQSSSGIIVSTGTGCSGWMSSLNALSNNPIALPNPEDQQITFRVREPWVSSQTFAAITAGSIQAAQSLSIVSKMETQGVIFGDGIEQDYLTFDWGQEVTISVAKNTLNICTNRR